MHAFRFTTPAGPVVVRAADAADLARQVIALLAGAGDTEEAARRARALWDVHVTLNLCDEECDS